MPEASSPPVSLDRDALYVATIPLTNGFHWSLIHVDRDGTATRHHWAATTVDPRGLEGYVAQPVPYGPRMKAGQQQILGYFKLLPDPSAGAGGPAAVDAAALRAACAPTPASDARATADVLEDSLHAGPSIASCAPAGAAAGPVPVAAKAKAGVGAAVGRRAMHTLRSCICRGR